ncbi:MAG: hypothetical protein ABI407_15830 [Bradyrhizobium sp.]
MYDIQEAGSAIVPKFWSNWMTVMEVVVESLLEGAKRATGTVAIIDVFCAFTSAAVAFSRTEQIE